LKLYFEVLEIISEKIEFFILRDVVEMMRGVLKRGNMNEKR
jgi:hypothetical protein